VKQGSAQVRHPKKRVGQKRGSRKRLYGGAFAAAAIAVAALVIASQLSARGDRRAAPEQPVVIGAADNARLFAAIPQRGNVLGSPRAPVTLVEYADLQCPYCGEFARNALPALVDEYVRTGRVKLVFRGLAFVGADSETALRVVLAAGEQSRLWNVAHLVYANQGVENTGWVTDGFLRAIARAVPPLDANRLLARAQSARVTAQIDSLRLAAAADAIRATPSFRVGRTGGRLDPLAVHSLDVRAFQPVLDALLGA